MPATIPTAIHATWTIDDRSAAARRDYEFADPHDALTVGAPNAPYKSADTPAALVAERSDQPRRLHASHSQPAISSAPPTGVIAPNQRGAPSAIR